MNTTELKALAEAVKGWKLRDVLQTPDDKDEGIAFVGHQSDVGIFDDIVHIDTGNYMQPHMAIVIATYYAAANPDAMLALIADLESAQDERRALLATEQNLRERVKALEEVAAAMLPFAEDASAINGYGYYRPENPHNFHPDAESCTEDEIAAHKAACDAWDAGTHKDDDRSGWIAPGVHVLKAPWGIGSYTDEVPEIAAICNRASALLEKTT